MPTETIRTIRDGESRTATSTFTQLLSSEQYPGIEADVRPMLLYCRIRVPFSLQRTFEWFIDVTSTVDLI